MTYLLRLALISVALLTAGPAQAAVATSLPDLPIPQSFGVNPHFLDKELPDNVAYLKKLGFGWLRRDLFWSDVEHTPGVYDFSAYDRLAKALQDAGIRILFVLDYDNLLYDKDTSPITDEARAAFARFAAAAASHYAHQNVAWEIYNEPNWLFWKPTPNVDQYIALADDVTRAIRQAAPDAVIMGPALAGPVLDPKNEPAAEEFLRQVFKSKAAHAWNAITVHPYRNKNSAPETISPQLALIRQMMRDAGLDPEQVPVIAGEWGYSTWTGGGVDERTQAAFAARELLWSTVEHMPFTIWYDWQDDGINPLDREQRFGLLRSGSLQGKDEAAVAKPAFTALAQLDTLLRGYRFQRVVENMADHICLAFRKDDHEAYVVWGNGVRHNIALSLPAGTWQVAHLLGHVDPMTSVIAQPVVLPVDSMPVILVPILPPATL